MTHESVDGRGVDLGSLLVHLGQTLLLLDRLRDELHRRVAGPAVEVDLEREGELSMGLKKSEPRAALDELTLRAPESMHSRKMGSKMSSVPCMTSCKAEGGEH